MIVSRTLARKRIARGERPSFRAAWAPVLADIIIVALLLAALWSPTILFVYAMKFSLFWTIVFMMVVFYAPLQIVIIVSTIWAVRSRWEEKP